MTPQRREPQPPPLYGLVLAGGDSARMGRDKGKLSYHGAAQAEHLLALLRRHCARAFVSIRAAQGEEAPYAGLPVIVDALRRQGPATGLLSARQAHPAVAWLAVAVDLALLDAETIARLVGGRRASAAATAFRHPDGTLEPLCAIWEPAGLSMLAERAAAGDPSPRRCLESADVECILAPRPDALRSIDSPEDRATVLDEQPARG